MATRESRSDGRAGRDPLPSWNDGAPKHALLDFVERTTTEGGRDFVRPAERIAVFDNDGTLWSEQPMYVQLAFMLDRLRALAPQHPEWRTQQPYRAALEGDWKGVAATGSRGLVALAMVTHAGNTPEEFAAIVEDWLATARHPRFGCPYTELVFQPMLELLSFLRARDFKTFIISGGGIEFIRVFSERVYGVPPEQVVGSSIKTRFELRDGTPTLVRLPEVDFIDDKEGKPVGINQCVGRRPLLAFGNSDGDQQMLEWTAAGTGPRLMLLVHHTDARREYAYDLESHVGKLDLALDEARRRGWVVVDMARDWRVVFPAEHASHAPTAAPPA